jgi:hypothetical protein
VTTPDSPRDPQDPQDLQDPTRPVEEHPATPGTDDTAVIEDDATQKVETAGSTTWAPAVAASPAPAASATTGAESDASGAASEPVAADSTAVAELPRPTGPHAPAIVLGIVCLAIAGLVIAQEVGSLKVDWGDVRPLGIVAAGAMLVLFGQLGLMTSRRNQS